MTARPIGHLAARQSGLWLSVVTTGREEMEAMLSRLLPEGAIKDVEVKAPLSGCVHNNA